MRGNKGKREKNKNKKKKHTHRKKKNATDVSKSNNSISSQGQAGGWAAQGWRGACAVPALPCGCGVLRGLPGPLHAAPRGAALRGLPVSQLGWVCRGLVVLGSWARWG